MIIFLAMIFKIAEHWENKGYTELFNSVTDVDNSRRIPRLSDEVIRLQREVLELQRQRDNQIKWIDDAKTEMEKLNYRPDKLVRLLKMEPHKVLVSLSQEDEEVTEIRNLRIT